MWKDQISSAWKVVWQSTKDFLNDNGMDWAGSIAFYSLLSIFPLFLGAIGIAAYFISPSWILSVIPRAFEAYVPSGLSGVVTILQEAIKARSSLSLISSLVLLWSGTRIFNSVMNALNIAFTTGENYTLFRRLFLELIMLLTIGALFLVALVSDFTANLISTQLGYLFGGPKAGVRITLEVVGGLLLLLSFYLTYLYVPYCRVHPKAAFWGALTAALIYQVARPLFVGYIGTFANYNLVYGSIAVIVTVVVWIWVASIILLFGGEIASHVQAMVIENHPKEEVETRHVRRSPTRKEVPGAALPPKEKER